MVPRIPKSKYEDQTTPRICVSSSIQGCLIGINENKDISGETYHVYSITTKNWYKPTKKEVADIEITDEFWVLDECTPKYEYDITIEKIDGYINSEINGNKFKVPKWKYSIVK